VHEFYGEDPQQTAAFGRVINHRAHDRLSALLRKDKKYVAFGGETDRADKYVAPTLLDFGTDFDAFVGSEAMSDEIFGPVFPIFRYEETDELINFVNAGEKPLAMYLFSDDEDTVEVSAAQITVVARSMNTDRFSCSSFFFLSFLAGLGQHELWGCLCQ